MNEIESMNFEDNTKVQLEMVTLYFQTYEDTVENETSKFNEMIIKTNAVGGYSMKNFVTHHHKRLWEIYRKRSEKRSSKNKCNPVLTSTEIQTLITGSKYKRIAMQQCNATYIEESESESDDPDYMPEIDDSDTSKNSDTDLNIVEESQLTNVTVTSTDQSCIKKILAELQKKDNKHNWRCHNVDSLLKNYLSSRRAVAKLFLYEMDIINLEVRASFGKKLFKKGDAKSVHIDKI